jgi:hypothetical protein
MSERLLSALTSGLFALVVLGCSGDSTALETRDPARLTVVALAPDHPDYFNTEAQVWARPGSESEVSLYLKDPSGERGDRYVRLVIHGASLRAFPDGHPFAQGDSVLITIRVPDVSTAMILLLPSGLQFNPGQPAELSMEYTYCEKDLDHDGIVSRADTVIRRGMAIWRQEMLTSPFIKLGTVNTESIQELNARLLGFSRFAIAY